MTRGRQRRRASRQRSAPELVVRLRAGRDHGLDIDAGGVALQHAVGEEQEPVAGLERQALLAVLVARQGPERGVDLELHRVHASVAQPERQRMPGVHDGGRPGAQVDAADLAGHEAALRRVVGEPVAREACLLGEPDTGPARVAQPSDHERGEQRGVDLVAHGVRQREVQHAPLEREVEGVAANVAGRLEPARDRELPGLAGVGARQEPVLDLGGQRQGHRALAPLEEVGEAAVGDDHIGQDMRGERDLGQQLLVGPLPEEQLQHADGLPPVGHRREHARPVRAGFDDNRLRGERPAW